MYLNEMYDTIFARAEEGQLNKIIAPMGSGKSTLIADYYQKNPENTLVLVFFKNAKEDFLDKGVPTMYYNTLFRKIGQETIDLSNTTVFCDDFSYLDTALPTLAKKAKRALDNLPTVPLAMQEWVRLMEETHSVLEYLRKSSKYLFLVDSSDIKQQEGDPFKGMSEADVEHFWEFLKVLETNF